MNSAAVGVRPRGGLNAGRLVRRHGWTVGVYVLLLVLVLFWRTIPANWGSFDVQSLAIDALPLAFAAMAQSVVIISGGIDLSVGSLISLVNVLSAKYMVDMSFRNALLFGALLLAGSAAAGAFTGSLTVLSRVPDIVVTLAMLFVWAGVALEILQIPGGGAPHTSRAWALPARESSRMRSAASSQGSRDLPSLQRPESVTRTRGSTTR